MRRRRRVPEELQREWCLAHCLNDRPGCGKERNKESRGWCALCSLEASNHVVEVAMDVMIIDSQFH